MTDSNPTSADGRAIGGGGGTGVTGGEPQTPEDGGSRTMDPAGASMGEAGQGGGSYGQDDYGRSAQRSRNRTEQHRRPEEERSPGQSSSDGALEPGVSGNGGRSTDPAGNG